MVAAPDPGIAERAALARDGFMTRCAEEVPTGRRTPFCLELLPEPAIGRSQWDHGDNTCRALRAWHAAREIAGADGGDASVEAGHWRYLLSILHPETGMAFVPEHSDGGRGPFYYHLWDQGRLFDYLVLRWSEIARSPTERADLLARIRRLQRGLAALSKTEDAGGARARWWPAEVFLDAAPQPETARRGPHDFRGWCIGASQFLPPQARLAALTNDPDDLALAMEAAHGFLAGFERRRGSTVPMFADDGGFRGHFHGAVSGLDGVLQLARLLRRGGGTEQADAWIDLAVRVYRRIFDAKRNANPGSTCGCFPETAREEPHTTSELCCTADMIELAAHLAECAAYPGREALADVWDDAERFLRNEVLKTQVTDVSRVVALVPRSTMSPERAEAVLRRMEGVWLFGRPFLHDLVRFQRPETIRAAAWLENRPAAGSADAPVPVLRSAGCCAYSGVRALHAVWRHAVAAAGETVEVRIPVSREAGGVVVEPLPGYAGLRLAARAGRLVRVRIPRHVDDVRVESAGPPGRWSGDRRWVSLELPAGGEAAVAWEPRRWSVAETFGPRAEQGTVPGVAAGERVRCTLHYRGPDVVRVEPGGAVLPYAAGL